jgi:hypothetical protein
MSTLKREAFIGWRPKLEAVAVPEIAEGGTVNVRTLTLADLTSRAIPALAESGDVTADLVILFAVDDDGAPIFTADDRAVIEAQAGPAMQRIALAGLRLNGLADIDPEAAEKAEGN